MNINQASSARRRRSASVRVFEIGVVLAAISGLAAPPVSAQPAAPAGPIANRIEAEAVNLRNSNGTFRCELFNSPNGFPRNDDASVAHDAAPIKDRRAVCVFPNVSPGDYAAVVLHDENDNHKMDYNFVGIPKEGYGFSNDPRVLLSPPSFDAAKFEYRGGVMRIPIQLHY